MLRDGLRLAEGTGEFQLVGPIYRPLAESAWLRGDVDAAAERIESALAQPPSGADPRAAGGPEPGVAGWDTRRRPAGAAPEVLAAQVEGRWADAARLWASDGRPYDEGLALVEAGTRRR